MKDAYTALDLASALGVTGRAVTKRAAKEAWPHRKRAGRGGGREFLAASLPEDVRAALAAAEARVEVPAIPAAAGGLAALDEKRRTVALAKADLVALYLDWLRKAPEGKRTAARDQFALAYEAGAWPKLREVLGRVSWKTVEAWKLALEKVKSPAALADRRGLARKGRTLLTRDALEILVAQAVHPNKPNVCEILRRARTVMTARGVVCELSDRQLRRALEDYMRMNYGEWVFGREGKKAWNDKCAFILERDYGRIEVGDILVADGHVLNFEVVNPETGRPGRMEMVVWYDMKSNMPLGWEIMPTENVACIASALRRAVLMLGKMPRVAYLDNGKAFRARYFNGVDFSQSGITGLFDEIGVRTIFAWPYHGQSKTVERFFGTFRDLETWVPSYVGTSIENKPPRLMRGEQLHRKLYEKSGRALTIFEAHAAVAWWFEQYGQRPQRGHLEGQCPWEVFQAGRGPGVDAERLRHLMLARKTSSIHRDGVHHLGRKYWHPELYERRHEVTVRYDLHDDSYVVVELPDGRCLECRPPAKVHPAARLLGTDEDVRQLEEAIAYKKAQERQASRSVRDMLTNCVLPETTARLRSVEVAREEATAPAEAPALSASKIKSIEAAKAKVRAEKSASDGAYYVPEKQHVRSLDRVEDLVRALCNGLVLRPEDAHWLAEYERTEEYKTCFAARRAQIERIHARRQSQTQGASA
jgi:putative transposase